MEDLCAYKTQINALIYEFKAADYLQRHIFIERVLKSIHIDFSKIISSYYYMCILIIIHFMKDN